MLDRIGSVHEKAGDLQKAVECYGEAIQIEWQVVHGADKPADSAGLDHHLARMFTKLGHLQVELRMDPVALRRIVGAAADMSEFGADAGDRYPFYKRAETILERLIRDNPTDARLNDFRRSLADCREHNAAALAGTDRDREALASYREALEIRRRLRGRTRRSPSTRMGWRGSASSPAGCSRSSGGGMRPSTCTAKRSSTSAWSWRCHREPAPRSAPWRAPGSRGSPTPSVGPAARNRRWTNIERPASCSPGWPGRRRTTVLRWATLHAGQAGLAGQGKTPLTERRHGQLVDRSAAAAVAALSRAIDAGFKGHDRALKEAVLDPLRSRDDFKKQRIQPPRRAHPGDANSSPPSTPPAARPPIRHSDLHQARGSCRMAIDHRHTRVGCAETLLNKMTEEELSRAVLLDLD